MWELDCEEGWALKDWCFWTVVLEKTLDSPLDCKKIQPVRSKGDQPWVFFGRNDAKAETPVLWPPHMKNSLIGKDSEAGRDWGQEEKGMTEDEMDWMASSTRRTWVWVNSGSWNGQGGLACCNSWDCKELDTTEWLNWRLKSFAWVIGELSFLYIVLMRLNWNSYIRKYLPISTKLNKLIVYDIAILNAATYPWEKKNPIPVNKRI